MVNDGLGRRQSNFAAVFKEGLIGSDVTGHLVVDGTRRIPVSFVVPIVTVVLQERRTGAILMSVLPSIGASIVNWLA